MNNSKFGVLLVDDSQDDLLFMRRALERSATLTIVGEAKDGQEAMDYLKGEGLFQDRKKYPWPDIMLLDLKMPRKNGFEVLDWMNRELPTERPPVAVFTSSQDTADIRRAYELGARWFLAKPVDYTELTQWVQLIGQWFQNPRENDLSSSLHYRAPRLPRTD